MNRLTLGLAGAWLLACAGTALAQGGPNGAMMPSYQASPAYGGMGGPYAQPAGYPMMQPINAQQAMYGGDSVGPGDAPSAMDAGSGGPYDGSCPQDGGGGGCCPPFVASGYAYGDVELFYARRTDGFKNQPLFLDGGATVVTTSGLAQDYEPGVKATFGYMWSQGFGVEGTYFGQLYFRNGRLASDTTNALLSLPGDIGNNTIDFDAVPQLSAIYRSQIQNGELNFVLPYGSFQYLWGFRYMQWQDLLDINGNNGAEASDYVIHTNNNLYGGQIGARGQWEIGMLQFEAAVKAGLFDNATNQQQTIRDFGNSVMVMNGTGDVRTDIDASKNTAAFVGEVDLSAMIPMGSHWTAKLGYTGVWVTDLALAPNQLDFGIPATNGYSVNTKGSPILHGFTAGMEFRY